MDWKNIPSLSALRAFEAAARFQNQSKAADELNVTQAAIAQHIRAIEMQLDVKLFEREGRNLRLTLSGEQLFEATHQGFEMIARGVKRASERDDRNSLKVTVTPSFYERWLMPRLPGFWALHPEIKLSISASGQLVDLQREDFDLALRYGAGFWSQLSTEFLLPSDDAVFASLDYVERFPEVLDNLSIAHWIRAEDSPEFFDFHKDMGVDFESDMHKSFSTNSEARAALIAGLGVLFQDRLFLRNEVAHGMVREIASIKPREGVGYYIVRREEESRPVVEAFLNWLREAAVAEIKHREACQP